MNRRRARQRQARAPQAAGPFRGWTIPRATNAGIVLGLVAILLAVVMSERLLYPYATVLAATALCGVSILWITAFDMRTRGTSGRMRPIRGFDLAVGLALLVPSLYALSLVWGELGL